MRAWRFHRSAYHPLDTTGAQTYGGRWNAKGVPALYASLTFGGGLLELIAHASIPRQPPRDHLASLIDVPDDGGLTILEPPLPSRWDHPDDYRIARELAAPWFGSGKDLCLSVPSVAGAPVERNVVINPRHRAFGGLQVVDTIGPVYDPRIWG